jgi:hypothetical protein
LHDPGDITVDALILIITAIAALIGFDWLALRFGTDSRDSIGDDHLGQTHSAAF